MPIWPVEMYYIPETRISIGCFSNHKLTVEKRIIAANMGN